ncbi:type VI secretion system-associated FHA domain protein TagH [Muribacter muris]|nr:type VI secretion system-associated FHA domain protein TagH [Muribacter muris]
MSQIPKNRLSMTITNSTHLESGKMVSSHFSPEGGQVGSGENNHWVIQDLHKNIPANQFRIEWRDHHFCLLVLHQSLLLNHAEFTPKSGFIRLKQGDIISVGDLVIRVNLEKNADTNIPQTIEEIVQSETASLHTMLSGHTSISRLHSPLSTSETPTMKKFDDPLVALNETIADTQAQMPIADESPLANKPQTSTFKEREFDQTFLDLPDTVTGQHSETLNAHHVALTPLIRELHTTLPIEDTQTANDFLEEIGKTLHAAIMGLLALQKEKNNLSDKHLRPIEDNPLRLNLDYSTTIDILFGAKKSPVHLSAPAAVSESLHNVLLHNKANTIAITAALNAILAAFSPNTLLNRFENYRRSNERQATTDAWAWEMYNNYYQELTSARQFGFEKLFWEVYSQAYDKALRDAHKN